MSGVMNAFGQSYGDSAAFGERLLNLGQLP